MAEQERPLKTQQEAMESQPQRCDFSGLTTGLHKYGVGSQVWEINGIDGRVYVVYLTRQIGAKATDVETIPVFKTINGYEARNAITEAEAAIAAAKRMYECTHTSLSGPFTIPPKSDDVVDALPWTLLRDTLSEITGISPPGGKSKTKWP